MSMKIIGIVTSPRRNKSSNFLLEQCMEEVKITAEKASAEVEMEILDLAGKQINGCIDCGKCKKGVQCSQQDDFQPFIEKLADPSVAGIILSTPVYMGTMTGQAKCFLDRTVLFRRNGFLFKDKIGGVIAVGGSRNGGQELTCQAVHAAMMIHDMIIVGNGGHFGGTAWGNYPDGYEADKVGVDTAKILGKRVVETVMKMHG